MLHPMGYIALFFIFLFPIGVKGLGLVRFVCLLLGVLMYDDFFFSFVPGYIFVRGII